MLLELGDGRNGCGWCCCPYRLQMGYDMKCYPWQFPRAREEPLTNRVPGYYAFWIWCWLLLIYYLAWIPRKFALAVGRDIARLHYIVSGWVLLLWMIYPICWGVSEGGNVIAPDSEFIFYGILDCNLIPITSAFFLAAHWKIDPARLGLRLRTYEDPLSQSSAISEKHEAASNDNPSEGVIPTEDAGTSSSVAV